ncbi:DUF3857 domain-containing protein, partial [Thermodesulfobacteriota bacterium]
MRKLDLAMLPAIAAGILTLAILAPGTRARAGESLSERIISYIDGHLEEKFPDEDYVYLDMENSVVIHDDGSYDTTCYRAVQILTPEGIEEYIKTQRISNAFFSTIKVDFARTINGENKIVETDEEDIIEQLLETGYLEGYYRKRRTTVPFSDLRIGSIIEFQYTVSYNEKFKQGQAWFDMPIQFEHPVLNARVSYRVPKELEFFAKAIGEVPVRESRAEVEGVLSITFEAKDVPALTDEVHTPSNKERAARVMASTFETWDDFARWFYPILEASSTITDEQWDKFCEDFEYRLLHQGRVIATHKFVYWKMKKHPIGLWTTGAHIPIGSKAIDFGGENKSAVALMIAMLRRRDVKAFPALLSTETLSIVPEIVNPDQFDRLLAYIPGRGFIDPMISYQYINDPLPDHLGKEAYILRPDGIEVASTPPIELPGDYTLIQKVVVNSNGSILVEDQHMFKENLAADMRKKMRTIGGGWKIKRLQVREYLEENWAHGDLLDWEYHQVFTLQGPFKIYVKFESDRYTSWADDLLILRLPIRPSPACESLLGEFRERTAPVEIEPQHYQYNCTIPLPPRLRLRSLPADVFLRRPCPTRGRPY